MAASLSRFERPVAGSSNVSSGSSEASSGSSKISSGSSSLSKLSTGTNLLLALIVSGDPVCTPSPRAQKALEESDEDGDGGFDDPDSIGGVDGTDGRV